MPHPPDQPVGIFPPAGPSQPGDTPSAGKSNKSDATDHSHRQSSAKRKTVHARLLESTLNTRFLFITVLLALGFAGVVILTHRLQIDHLTDALLTRAKAAAEKEPKLAQRWYRDYLKLRKDDLDARTQLAELQMQTAESRDQWMAAFRSNEAVLRADAGQTDIRRQQVDVCFRLGRFQEAREHLEELLQANDKDGALHMLLGLACEEDRKYREAVAEYGLAVEDDDFRSVETLDQKWTVFQAYANRARILHEELNDPRRAGRVCRELLKKYPSSPEAFLIRAHHHNRVGSTTLAVDDARKAVELDPDNAEALMLAAQLTLADPHSSQDDVGSVGDLLSAVTGEVRDDSRLYILLAQFERRRGDMEKAITTLKEGIERATDNQGLTSLLISQLISLGRIDEARATLAEKEEPPDSKNDPDSLYLEGGIFLREGQPAKALKRLQEARTRAVTDSQLYQLASVRIGRCWLALDRPHQALEEFNAVVRVNPSSVEAQTGLATALASTGQPVAALHVRRQLPVENLPAALQLARLELRAVMAQLPNDRDFQPVETALQAADEFDAESNEVSLIRAMMLTADGKREEARQELHSAASRRPVNVRVIGAQVQMALADRDTELAQSLLDHAGTHLTDNPELDRYQLSVWKETDPRRFKVALQEFETKEYPATAENRFRLLESIAVWHREVGNARRELMALLKAAESRGNDVDSWLRMLKPALDLKLLDVRDRVMTEMQSLAGDNDVRVRYAKTVVLVHDSQADPTSPKRAEAHRLLEEIVEERSDWSPPYVLLGQMHLRDNQRGKAAEWYRLAVLHGNRQPAILRLTSRLLVDQMRPQEAIQLFEDIRGSATGRMRTMTTELIGQIFASQGKGSDTLQLVRDDVASGIAGSMDRFMKGQMLYMSGAYDAAEAEFRGAVEEEPSEAGGWLALAGFLMRRGDQAAAADVVTEAEARLIDADNPVALARCFELVGRTEDAEQHLASALRVEPENGAVRLALASFFVRFKRWSEARKLIDPMLETPDQFPGTDRLAVRRLKVRTIAFTSFAGFKKSLELLQANIDEAVDRSTDQRIRARLLASHTQLEFVRQGLDLYSVVERKVALTAPEKLVVARAYDRLHAEKTADDRWQSLLNDHSRQPGLVEAYVVRQLKRGHPEGLQKHIGKLPPNSWTSVKLSVGLDLEEGRIEAATTRLDRYLSSAKVSVGRVKRMQQVAGLLAELSSSPQLPEASGIAAFRKADAIYQDLIAHSNRSVPAYARLMARQGSLKSALDLLERKESGLHRRLRAAFGVQLIQHAAHDDPQVERVHRWISALREKNPDTVPLMHMEAAICLRRQQYDKAVELIRMILKQRPEDVNSLNNLAWIVGTQNGDHQKAFELLETAGNVAGEAAFLLDTRGLVSLEMGRIASALDDLETAWRQDNSPVTQYHLALALSRFGDTASAQEHFNEALAAGLHPHMLEAPEVAEFEKLQNQLDSRPDVVNE